MLTKIFFCYSTKFSGASSGIGQGIAAEYAQYGPKMALTGRSMERLEETKKLCIESGARESDVSIRQCNI